MRTGRETPGHCKLGDRNRAQFQFQQSSHTPLVYCTVCLQVSAGVCVAGLIALLVMVVSLPSGGDSSHYSLSPLIIRRNTHTVRFSSFTNSHSCTHTLDIKCTVSDCTVFSHVLYNMYSIYFSDTTIARFLYSFTAILVSQ